MVHKPTLSPGQQWDCLVEKEGVLYCWVFRPDGEGEESLWYGMTALLLARNVC